MDAKIEEIDDQDEITYVGDTESQFFNYLKQADSSR